MATNSLVASFEQWVRCFEVMRSSLESSLKSKSKVISKCEQSIHGLHKALLDCAGVSQQRTLQSLEGIIKIEGELLDCQQLNFNERSVAAAQLSDVLLPSDEGSRGPTLKQLVDAEDVRSPEVEISPIINYSLGQKKKYRKYTLEEKEYAVRKYEEGLINITKLSEQLGIPSKNIRRWSQQGIRKRHSGRKIRDLAMEQTLQSWLFNTWRSGKDVSNRQIKEQALRLTSNTEFKASKGWLVRFIGRCGHRYENEMENMDLNSEN